MLTSGMSVGMAETAARRARLRRPRGPELTVQYGVPRRGLPARASLERWAQAALRRGADVTVRFVGSAEGRALNRAYRGKDYATNVLTFAYPGTGRSLSGDSVLGAPVGAREARDQGKPLGAHFAHLVVHGLLHLQGHEHDRDRAARRMEALERRILGALGYADPYGEGEPVSGRRRQ
jgi:probable rRNA maturation factor